MSAIPSPAHNTAAEIYRWYERQAGDGLRPHLGGSEIGNACERATWYSFRHAALASFDGRILRLFETGKREEVRIIANLRAIGCEVHADDGGEQFTVSALGGHAGGSMDGVVRKLPEAPKTWHLLECKTANAKTFKAIAGKGVKVAKPEHYAQMIWYGGLAELSRWLYVCTNKDTDEMHVERGDVDPDEFVRLLDRASRIITSDAAPERISDDPDYFACKWCRFSGVCYGKDAPLVNCRTCAHSTPDIEAGGWTCARNGKPPAVCGEHRFLPSLLTNFAEVVDGDAEENLITYRNKLTGATFINGPHPALSSLDIAGCDNKAMLGQECADPTLRAVRLEFGASYAEGSA